MNLNGRAVLITGGKRVGAAVASGLAAGGANVALSYNRSKADAEQAAAAVEAEGRRAVAIQVDLSQPEECARLVNGSAKTFGRLDILVNMASVYSRTAYDELTEQDWDRSLAVDLTASFLCARAAVPYMRAQGGGRIVNFADWVAASGRPRYVGFLPYYVAKRGVIALTEALALELADDQILVNAIAPGPIRPPDGLNETALAEVERVTPLGRWGGDQEIVKAVLALVETDFMTGETIRVDGGRHLR
ncbi:MAG: short-chain dehydrogenase [Acidobacteria bacterium]|jgi:NAD(P)-dependent dehydrogenase (short-subunit alcohol dehydrogenase family)|nr:short-chain dehydrogenase [Acidobacteriota bacterium]MBQ37843.1 short-chain dehydrogenase [Gemmatimonadaceae bacterium]MDP7338041.1 SDR family oxidoreductase [Vicinamibacterales bacterium]MDP7481031.1 SDR family oxidoreductase [Vicinamibacterales bacterium]HJN43319.1 SDR family oxidoreductase [Vicinamibacterales bacterium]